MQHGLCIVQIMPGTCIVNPESDFFEIVELLDGEVVLLDNSLGIIMTMIFVLVIFFLNGVNSNE